MTPSLAILLVSLACIIVLFKPLAVNYILLVIFAAFTEIGQGFTSFEGSIFFNQDFLNFYKFRLIEFVVLVGFISFFLRDALKGKFIIRNPLNKPLSFLILWISFLLLFEMSTTGRITPSDWRFVASGILLFYMFLQAAFTKGEVEKLCWVFLAAITIKAFVGLGAYLMGRGLVTFRGSVPFFWDNSIIKAFSAALLFCVSFIVFCKPKGYKKLYIMCAVSILFLSIMFSLRRGIWIITFIGVAIVFMCEGVANLSKHLSRLFMLVLLVVLILTVANVFMPQEVLQNVSKLFISMNVLDQDARYVGTNPEHIRNIQEYLRLFETHPIVMSLGFRGVRLYDGRHLRLMYESTLGTAHNGLVQSMYIWGIGGVIFYLWFFFAFFRYVFSRLKYLSPRGKGWVLGFLGYLIGDFTVTLLFLPPFYTTFKGNLLQFFVMACVIMLVREESSENGQKIT